MIHDGLRAHPPTGAWLVRVRRRGFRRMLVIHTQFNLYYFWEMRWFFVAMALGLFLLTLTPPQGLSQDGLIVR